MKFGKRSYHRMPYLSRQHAKYKRRLKKAFIPSYGKHRPFSYKQWKNRNYQRAYRTFTYPSFRASARSMYEGRNPYNLHGYGRRSYQEPAEQKPYDVLSTKSILINSFWIAFLPQIIFGHFFWPVYFISVVLLYAYRIYLWKQRLDKQLKLKKMEIQLNQMQDKLNLIKAERARQSNDD